MSKIDKTKKRLPSYQKYRIITAFTFSITTYFATVYINGNFSTYKDPTLFRGIYGLLALIALLSFIFIAYSSSQKYSRKLRLILIILSLVSLCIFGTTTLAFMSVRFFG